MFAVHWTIETIGNKSLPWTAKQSVITINFYIKPSLLVCKCLSMHHGKVASFSYYSSINTKKFYFTDFHRSMAIHISLRVQGQFLA